jgi:DNA-binding beta-propeller fold protein YncE
VAGCGRAVAQAPTLPGVRTAFVALSGQPFGVATTSDGRWSFVDELGGHVVVFSDAGFVPSALRTIDVLPGDAVGNALTRDGRYLLVADGGGGATVVSVARAESGAADAVLGALEQPTVRGKAIEVASSPDSRYVFVSIESGDAVAAYDLHAALADHFRKSSYLGSVPVGRFPVGLAMSPSGRWLYATSEVGTLSVISVAKAERDPARAVVTTVPAGCEPVRVVVSANGKVVWVTARKSDQLLAFSAEKLRDDRAHALLAAVRVGLGPVGLALTVKDREVIVADRGQRRLTVVSATAALAHKPAVFGTIPAGSQPREMAIEPNGDTLLVGNFGSDQLEAIAIGQLGHNLPP